MEKEMVVCTGKCEECPFSGECELKEVKDLEKLVNEYKNEIKTIQEHIELEEKYKETKQYNEIMNILNKYLGFAFYNLRSTLEELKEYEEDMRTISHDEIDKRIEECDNTIKEVIFLGNDEAYRAFLEQMRR